jgi:hypothetical protein
MRTMHSSKQWIGAGAACALLALSHAAGAEPATVAASVDTGAPAAANDGAKPGGSVLLGAKVGGIVPFGGLSPFVSAGVEAGYVFPWLHRSFAAAIDADYTAPSKEGSDADARLGAGGGSYDWHLTQKQLAIMPVFLYRITSLGSLVPYAGIGPRVYLLESTVRGSFQGAEISETTEKSTKVGVGVPIGVEYHLGPGGLIAELLLQYGGLDHTATGSSNTGAASLSVGYRFLL